MNSTKILLTNIAVISLVFCESTRAEIIAGGDDCGPTCHWELDDTGHFVVSGTGAMYGYPNETTIPWRTYKSSITSIEIQNGITRIGQDTFKFANAREISIPPSVTYIDNSAFEYTRLTSVTLPPTVTGMGVRVFNQIPTLTEAFCSTAQIRSGICFGSSRFGSVAVGEYKEGKNGYREYYNASGQHIYSYDSNGILRHIYGINGAEYHYDSNGNLNGMTKRGPFTIPEANALTKDGPVNTVTFTW